MKFLPFLSSSTCFVLLGNLVITAAAASLSDKGQVNTGAKNDLIGQLLQNLQLPASMAQGQEGCRLFVDPRYARTLASLAPDPTTMAPVSWAALPAPVRNACTVYHQHRTRLLSSLHSSSTSSRDLRQSDLFEKMCTALVSASLTTNGLMAAVRFQGLYEAFLDNTGPCAVTAYEPWDLASFFSSKKPSHSSPTERSYSTSKEPSYCHDTSIVGEGSLAGDDPRLVLTLLGRYRREALASKAQLLEKYPIGLLLQDRIKCAHTLLLYGRIETALQRTGFVALFELSAQRLIFDASIVNASVSYLSRSPHTIVSSFVEDVHLPSSANVCSLSDLPRPSFTHNHDMRLLLWLPVSVWNQRLVYDCLSPEAKSDFFRGLMPRLPSQIMNLCATRRTRPDMDVLRGLQQLITTLLELIRQLEATTQTMALSAVISHRIQATPQGKDHLAIPMIDQELLEQLRNMQVLEAYARLIFAIVIYPVILFEVFRGLRGMDKRPHEPLIQSYLALQTFMFTLHGLHRFQDDGIGGRHAGLEGKTTSGIMVNDMQRCRATNDGRVDRAAHSPTLRALGILTRAVKVSWHKCQLPRLPAAGMVMTSNMVALSGVCVQSHRCQNSSPCQTDDRDLQLTVFCGEEYCRKHRVVDRLELLRLPLKDPHSRSKLALTAQAEALACEFRQQCWSLLPSLQGTHMTTPDYDFWQLEACCMLLKLYLEDE